MRAEGTATLRDGTLTADDEVTVRACPGGPWLVRGAAGVVDADGTSHPTTRPVVAVCACGKTQRAPWCDGTHKVVPGHRGPTGTAQSEARTSPTNSPAA